MEITHSTETAPQSRSRRDLQDSEEKVKSSKQIFICYISFQTQQKEKSDSLPPCSVSMFVGETTLAPTLLRMWKRKVNKLKHYSRTTEEDASNNRLWSWREMHEGGWQ